MWPRLAEEIKGNGRAFPSPVHIKNKTWKKKKKRLTLEGSMESSLDSECPVSEIQEGSLREGQEVSWKPHMGGSISSLLGMYWNGRQTGCAGDISSRQCGRRQSLWVLSFDLEYQLYHSSVCSFGKFISLKLSFLSKKNRDTNISLPMLLLKFLR